MFSLKIIACLTLVWLMKFTMFNSLNCYFFNVKVSVHIYTHLNIVSYPSSNVTTTKPNGILASLDVESLFTNVPIEATTDIILKKVHHHESIPTLKLPPKILAELLRSCTSMAPFRSRTRWIKIKIIEFSVFRIFPDDGLCYINQKFDNFNLF